MQDVNTESRISTDDKFIDRCLAEISNQKIIKKSEFAQHLVFREKLKLAPFDAGLNLFKNDPIAIKFWNSHNESLNRTQDARE